MGAHERTSGDKRKKPGQHIPPQTQGNRRLRGRYSPTSCDALPNGFAMADSTTAQALLPLLSGDETMVSAQGTGAGPKHTWCSGLLCGASTPLRRPHAITAPGANRRPRRCPCRCCRGGGVRVARRGDTPRHRTRPTRPTRPSQRRLRQAQRVGGFLFAVARDVPLNDAGAVAKLVRPPPFQLRRPVEQPTGRQ